MDVVQRGGRSSGHVQNGRAVGDDDDGSGEDDDERGDGQRDRQTPAVTQQEAAIRGEVREINHINSSKGSIR